MNAIRPWRTIERRQSRQIMVGSVPVGGDAPISVQTMTNTPTEDVAATLDQIRASGYAVDQVGNGSEADAALAKAKRSGYRDAFVDTSN